MKSKLSLTFSAAAALGGVPPAIANDRKLTMEDIASYGLTLDEFAAVRASESPDDFGVGDASISDDDTNQLWLDAAVFEYEVAMSHASDFASTSSAFHPYLVCSTEPSMSGAQRQALVNQTFQETPGIQASDLYSDGNLFHNDGSTSCGVLRAYNDTIAKVFAHNPDAALHMTVNPLHPSMKMTVNTVDILRNWFEEGDEAMGAVSISEDDPEKMGRMQVKTMGLHMVLCPGVQSFGQADDVPDDQIANDVRGFVTKDEGAGVRDLSFYYRRASGMDGDEAVRSTERMDEWSAAIDQVANNWTKADGSNVCLDTILDKNMMFEVNERVLDVNAKISTLEGLDLALSLGLSEEDLETCIWYMTYSLALCPMVCTLEPRTKVKTLCEDGTSDLTKCTRGVNADLDGGVPDSSAVFESGLWATSSALVTLFFSSLLGYVIV